MIDWNSTENIFFLNPRQPSSVLETAKSRIQTYFQKNPNQSLVALQTSGSTGESKIVIHKKRSFLIAAEAVNKRLKAKSSDIWLRALPEYHVGGLSIEARASLTGSQVVVSSEAWNPIKFFEEVQACKASWISLVPTQLFDLVQLTERAPDFVQGVILGGAFTSDDLAMRAQDLGWPLWWSYGMTETCAMISLSPLPKLDPLDHVDLQISKDNYLEVKSDSLLLGYLQADGTLFDPKKRDGWWTTSDKIELKDGRMKLLGRGDDFVKISGEGIYLQELQTTLDRATDLMLKPAQTGEYPLVWTLRDERRGNTIVAVFPNGYSHEIISKVLDDYNKRVLPVFKINQWTTVPIFPRNGLGKILRAELQNSLKDIAWKKKI